MRYVLALDQGTTSSRAILFDRDATVCAIEQREFAQYFPKNGWVEHDATEIWRSQLDVARAVIAKISSVEIATIGITNQRETTILWDRVTGVPLAPAIVWQDRRTAPMCEALREAGADALVIRKTGLVLDPYFSATKIAWLLDATPGLRERAERGEIAFGTVDSWLLWNLTGRRVHATDHTNASRTLLFDLRALDWDDELLALFRVPRAVLPEIRPSIGLFGACDAEWFGASVPIGAMAGDQQAALFGQAGLRRGLAKNTYGTGSFVMLNTGEMVVESRSGLLSTVAYTTSISRAYALEGSVFTTGAAVQWLRDGLGIVASSREADALARSVPDSGGVWFVPAFAGLGAPYWDPYARGVIIGLTRGTTKAHLARAAIEAMAFQSADVLEAMERDAGCALRELRVDGGASVNDLAMQLQADLLGVDVVRPRITETTALGVAFMAGLHAGYWENLGTVERLWSEERRFTPSIGATARTALLDRWRRAVERSRDWARE